MITILGLGPGDPNLLTVEAREILEHSDEVFLRTRQHPTVAALPARLKAHSFDSLYDKLSDFDAIYSTIAAEIVARGEKGDVLYAVPGHPLFAEISVQKILAQAREKGIAVQIVAGISFVDASCAALALDPLARGLQIADGTDVARWHFPHLDTDQPALIGQLYSRAVASNCKLTLLVLYPPDHAVVRVDAAGTPQYKIETLPLAELDHADDFGLLTTLYVPPLPRPSSFNALAEVVARLRAPDGCSWDREQTHESLRHDLLEEAYEVLETIDQDDMPHLQEELGDLLLLIVMQTAIASESGEFLFSDVAADISEKLVRRHPHIFGNVKVNSTAEILENWEQIKQKERGGKKKPGDGIPLALPALMRAQKIAKQTKTVTGLREISERVNKLPHMKDKEKALGELLFALAAYASDKHIDAESALRKAAGRVVQEA